MFPISGDNSDKLCKLCIGKVPGGKCTNADPYAGFTGAFRCLLEAGEIAFLKHTSVLELTADSINFRKIFIYFFNSMIFGCVLPNSFLIIWYFLVYSNCK